MESIKDIKKNIEDIKQYILLGTISNKFRWKFNRDDEEIIEYRFGYPTTILQVTKEKIIFISTCNCLINMLTSCNILNK